MFRLYSRTFVFKMSAVAMFLASIGWNYSARPTPVPTPTPNPEADYTETANGINLEMVWIEGGSFLMGSPASEEGRESEEGPQHRVELDGYWMGKYEVTQDEWRKVMGTSPSRFKVSGRLPVERVSWHDAMEFCRKLTQMTGKKYALPTEAQWEYACRAGTTTTFSTGKTITTDQANFNGKFTYAGSRKGTYREKTTEVGNFQANGWGLYDMHGNVWEWCADRYGDGTYDRGASHNPVGPSSGSLAVLRGGSWNTIPRFVRLATRYRDLPGYRIDYIGFRLSRTSE